MHLMLLAVGRLRPAFREAADEYLRRLGRYVRAEEVEVKEAGRSSTEAEARRVEGARLREKVRDRAHVVALDREAPPWSSEALARQTERWERLARPVAIVIGGSTGLEAALLREADQRWGLGPLTLPHELARVVVLEQLYRAWTIRRGEPYHK